MSKPSMKQGKASGVSKSGMGANYDGSSQPAPSTASRKGKSSGASFSQTPGVTQPKHSARMFGKVTQPSRGPVGGSDSPRSGY